MLLLAVMSALVIMTNALEIKRIPVVSVTGVEGGAVELPCEVSHPPDDDILLLLWFRDHLTTPIYRLDERWLGRGKERHWSEEQQLGRRAVLQLTSSPAVLQVSSLTRADQGLYTCRVDFMYHPTKTTRVNLTVVVPPKRVSVVMGGHKTAPRSRSSSVVGPYLEGDTPKLTCVAYGGNPRPSVVWFEGKYLLDSFMESEVSENSIKTLDELEATTLGPGPLTLQPAYGGDPFNMLTLGPPTPRPAFEGNLYNTLMPGRPTPKPAFGGEPYNTLTLGPLSRSHLNLQLTCEASNNNITKPTTLMVIVEMNLPPLSVEILPPDSKSPLMAGLQYKVECVVVGAQPPPRVSWWGGYERLLQTTKASVDAKENSAHGNVTTNRLIFTPRPEDNGSSLRCIAESRDPPVTLEDSWPLSVHYVPTARCSYGASLDSTNIKEGDDVYFECYIEANPPVTRVSWRHNDVALVHNVSAGVIVSNQSLVLQQVVRAQAGRYSCLAHNPVGDGASNSLRLDVKYAPVCSPGQVTTYAVGRYEDAEVTCSVEANPLQESFQWTFNNTADTIDVPQGRFSSSSSHSVITYTPMTALDYGTLLCWAANEIGSQREPCVFHIVPAGKPESPSNCTVGGRSRTSVRVRCVAGGSGGLPQYFLLQAIFKGSARHHLLNFTASSTPDFHVEGLQVDGKYQLVIRAVNEKGSSGATHLIVSSIGTNGSIYQLHDGPLEAEVRDGGQTNVVNEGTANDFDVSSFDALVLPSFIVGVLGVGSGLVLIVILLLLFITFRRRRRTPRAHPLSESLQQTEVETVEHHHSRGASKSPKCSHESPVLMTPEHDVICLERDMQQAESESDADPDVIPLQEASYRGYEVPPAATLLPSDRYKYAPVPAHLPNIPCPSQYSSMLGVTQAAPPLTTGQPGGRDLPDPSCLGPHHHHHHYTYLHQQARSSTLPRRTNVNPNSASLCSYTPTASPHQFPCSEGEGSFPPPPPEYLDCERKRVTFSRHASYEEDTPSTPLLKKGESSV